MRRLGWIALVYAIGYITGPLTRLILTGVCGTIDSYEYVIPDVLGLWAMIMALAILALARRGVLSSSRLLDLGLVFPGGRCAGHRRPVSSGMECRYGPAFPSWFQANARGSSPTHPSFRTLRESCWVPSVLAASMGPAGLAISAVTTGAPIGRPLENTYFVASSYLCAILAYVIARIVHRFNLQMKARRNVRSCRKS